jgi:hypothetical protein
VQLQLELEASQVWKKNADMGFTARCSLLWLHRGVLGGTH